MQKFLWSIDKEHLAKIWGWGERSKMSAKDWGIDLLFQVGRQRTERIDLQKLKWWFVSISTSSNKCEYNICH